MRLREVVENVGRRRLLLWSAPVVLVVVVAIVALVMVVRAADSAVGDFQRGDVDALRDDVATMRWIDVDSAATAFAEGALAVLEGRLEDAEEHFGAAATDDPTCPALVNLALVGETRGDQFVGVGDGPEALNRYRAALTTVTGAPPSCFAENTDPDRERRDVRARSAERLAGKIALLERPLPPPPAAPPPPPPAGTPPPAAGSDQDADRERDDPDQVERVLNPGDPLDQLGQLLLDGAATRGAP